MTEVTSNLLTCPFCGDPPTIEGAHLGDEQYLWTIACRNGHCHARPDVGSTSRSIAIEHWNKRSAVETTVAQDAARYRWLRSHGFTITNPNADHEEWTFGANEGIHVEQAIDAWRNGQPAFMDDIVPPLPSNAEKATADAMTERHDKLVSDIGYSENGKSNDV